MTSTTMRRGGVMAVLLCALAGCSPQRDQHATREAPQSQPASVDAGTQSQPTTRTDSVPKDEPAVVGGDNPATNSSPAIVLREFLPHIRLDAKARVVEFDGVVPINAHDERAPRVYLEVLACSRDTREHEALVVTEARPSQVHAALLAIGLEPGKPGSYSWQGAQMQANKATGPRVRVDVIVGEGEPTPITDWALNVKSGQSLTSELHAAGHAMLFAGSVSVERNGAINYLGDGSGTLVGLATFGTETIACESMYHHESEIEEPVWIAAANLVPAVGTGVRVRISAE